jgi:heme/copper-type cytochrome/quinol oxidase subunit 1
MTVTADAPAAAPASESTAPTPVPTGLAAILGSGDHKVVGRIWLAVALLHLLLLGAATVLVSAERVDSSAFEVLGKRWVGPVDTFQFISLAFLFLVPLTIAVAIAIVPPQVGASTLAFPRAAASAAWGYLLGGGLLVAAYAMHGGPDGTDEKGAVLFTVAFGMLLLSLLVAWICIATTVITLRTTGMRLLRVPLFAWSALVAGGVWILTLPVLLGLSVLSYLDAQYGGFLGSGAGSAYGRIAWAFGTPAVYALAIPVLGFVGSVVPVFLQTRHQQHRVALGLIGAFGALSVGAWTMPSLNGTTPWLYKGPWVVVSIAVLVPLLGLVGLWALTARQGRLAFGSPVLYAVSATLLLLLGAAAGAVQAIKPIKTLVDGPGTTLYGTSWSTATMGILALAGITAMIGGVVYWAPRLVGHRFPEGGARLVAVLLLLGTLVTGVPELVAGLLGQPASAALAPAQHVATIEHLELVTTIGNGILVLAGLLFILLLLKAATSKDATDDDPWSGHTLEWATTSPPKISSEAPLYDARHRPEEVDA